MESGAVKNNDMTEAERIQYIIDHCCGGSYITFARSVGIERARLSKIIHGHTEYRIDKFLPVILAVYPDVNPEWLYTGNGAPGVMSRDEMKAKYEAIIAEKDAMIRTLRRVIEERLNGAIMANDQQSANRQ